MMNEKVYIKSHVSAAVLGIFIWAGQSKAKQILGRPTGVVYIRGDHGDDPRRWVGQERVWVGHGLPGLIARTASGMCFIDY